jgi:hypothetical protein
MALNTMTEKLPTAHIDLVRQKLRGELEELLACDALWHGKLTRELLDQAVEAGDDYRCSTIAERRAYFGEEITENSFRFLLRDLIATGRAKDMLMAWAREGAEVSPRSL